MTLWYCNDRDKWCRVDSEICHPDAAGLRERDVSALSPRNWSLDENFFFRTKTPTCSREPIVSHCITVQNVIKINPWWDGWSDSWKSIVIKFMSMIVYRNLRIFSMQPVISANSVPGFLFTDLTGKHRSQWRRSTSLHWRLGRSL